MDHERTLELLAKALQIAPGDWETRSHMASLCLDLGLRERALGLLEAAPALPEDGPGRLAAAELFARAGSESAALRVADSLLADNRANAKAHLLKAHIYRGRGMVPEARKSYHLAAVIDASVEDLEFEAWLDGREPPPPPADPSPNQTRPLSTESPFELSSQNPPSLPAPVELPFDEDPDEFDRQFEEASELLARRAGEDDELGDEAFGLDFSPVPLGSMLPEISFSDVGGMEELKERMRMKFIYPFKNEGVYSKFKKRAGGGLLLYGPPGCGKTLIARATAGECGTHFHSISIPQVLSKWFGESENRLHEAFEQARANAPSILFIDEIDALGGRRQDAPGPLSNLVNVLLTEIDGASSNNSEVLVLGATNTPWRVDAAFRRPGRFDQTVFVPPPDAEARGSILRLLLKDLPTGELDFDKLVAASHRFSGADLKAAVDAAVETAIAEEMKSGRDTLLTGPMLGKAIRAHRPTTLEWLEQAANYASYANRSGLYDELAEYLKS